MSDMGENLEELNQWLSERNLSGFGPGRRARWGPQTESRVGSGAFLWKWADIYPGLLQAAKLVTVGPGAMTEMRSMQGVIPGARAPSIFMNTQILMPGERTRAHRNMKNETRLVHRAPPGAVFVCDGQAFPMERGDVIVSPTWTDHDHYNGGTEPAIWIEGFDTGYSGLGAEINERYSMDKPFQEILQADGYSPKTLGHVGPASGDADSPRPPMRYPWAETRATLDALKESEAEGHPCDGLHLTFASPVDGGPTLPTICWHVQLLRPLEQKRAHRHNSTAYYHVFQGEGVTVVEDQRLEWSSGDIFMVPPWTWHQHENSVLGDAILFSMDDWPAMSKLGFYKYEEAAA